MASGVESVHDDRRGLAAAGELEAQRLHFSKLKERDAANSTPAFATFSKSASSSKTPTLKESKLSQTALPVCPADELHHGGTPP